MTPLNDFLSQLNIPLVLLTDIGSVGALHKKVFNILHMGEKMLRRVEQAYIQELIVLSGGQHTPYKTLSIPEHMVTACTASLLLKHLKMLNLDAYFVIKSELLHLMNCLF